MAKISLAGFKDPVRRPRYIIWTGVAVMVLAAFVVVAFGATSTYWFCAEVCHKVQDDSIAAYDRSSHNMVSCMSCHEPVNANPIVFTLKKAKALGELVLTVTNNFELPLNPTSHLALNREEMGSEQCTQCHSENRVITPSDGIIIDHAVHEENEVQCTACHNRIAHNESGDWEPELYNPNDGPKSVKHANFMSMTACFRCHTLTSEVPEGGIKAPGKCSACHPLDFDLKPANHKTADFYPAGHAELAMAPIDRSTGKPVVGGEATEAEHEAEGEEAEGEEHEAEEGEEAEHGGEEEVLALVSVESLNYCSTCHVIDKFCADCHGMEMPHPDEFKTKSHPQVAATLPEKCDLCHQTTETNYKFCNDCHHGSKVNWTYDANVEWQTQHASAVVENGVAICLGACHEQQFCVDCHTALQPVPTSHEASDWLHGALTVTVYGESAAAPSAAHAVNAIQAIDSCEVCHGTGGANADFCANCHGMEMPHPDTFKTNHVSGANTPALCANCHQLNELCSDCHHVGASNTVAWQSQHPKTIADSGADQCFEKCHEDKQFCVDCHTTLNAVPASHTATDWTHNFAIDGAAGHSTAYLAATDSCDYCHGVGGVEAAFCSNCHKLEMPHPGDFKDTHGPSISDGTTTKAVCENCHNQFFCDSCHHEGASTSEAWRTFHPNIVREEGADPCFQCHEPTFCSYCHVRLIH